MAVTTIDPGPPRVVGLTGEIDVANADDVARFLFAELCREPLARIVVDLSALTFLDIGGARRLVDVFHRLEERGETVIIQRPRPAVSLVLGLIDCEAPTIRSRPATRSRPPKRRRTWI